MFMAEILQRKLLRMDLMHHGAGVGNCTDLVGIELLPPIQWSSDVKIDSDHPHELTMVRAGIAEGSHERQVILTDDDTVPTIKFVFTPGTTPRIIFRREFFENVAR